MWDIHREVSREQVDGGFWSLGEERAHHEGMDILGLWDAGGPVG